MIKESIPVDKQKDAKAWRAASAQTLAVTIKNCVLFSYGMCLGFPTILIPSLSEDDKKEPLNLGKEGISWIGSLSFICVPLGCVVSGLVTQTFGRRRSLQFVTLPFIISWLIYHFSSEIWHIFAALIISGITGGLCEAPVLTYVTEITEPRMRGMLSSTSTMSVTAGTMTEFILGTFMDWRTAALCSTIMPIFTFVLLFFIPETPIWLMSQKRFDLAKKSLAWLRGWVPVEEINEEYTELYNSIQIKSGGYENAGFKCDSDDNVISVQKNRDEDPSSSPEKLTKMETLLLFKRRNFFVPFLLVSYVYFLSHFNGSSAITTYAVKIFKALKAPIDDYAATALLGVLQVLGCLVCVSLVHYVGKRLLSFVSLAGTAVCFIIIGIYAHLNDITTLEMSSNSLKSNLEELDRSSWFPFIMTIMAAFLAMVGIRVVPWILSGEVFSTETRAIASGLAASSFYVFGFLSNKIFLSMVDSLTLPGTFWVFSAVCVVGVLTLYFLLPETEGKTLQEISDHFKGKSRLGNKVRRRKNSMRENDITKTETECRF